jgi:hypothetical protein
MTKLMIRVLLTLVCVAAMCLAQVKPITKKGLVDALKIGGLTQPELVQFVKQRGVDFRLTPSDEGELKTAGASADLLAAVKSSTGIHQEWTCQAADQDGDCDASASGHSF